MSNIIQLKSSDTDGKLPVVGDLTLGEVALNTFNGKMFIKKDDGAESIVEIGQRFNIVESDFTATASQTDFVVSGEIFSSATCYTNGTRDKSDTYSISDDGTDTTVSFTTGKVNNDWVLIEFKKAI